jgi:hypothetical protein
MLSLSPTKGRIAVFAATLAAVGTTGALVAPAAGADPPSPPPGCSVVVNTPASVTGSLQGQTNKGTTFDRLCVTS